ncbi:zinc finger MYM-type protein 1-like protein [Tanacetum coccineum]
MERFLKRKASPTPYGADDVMIPLQSSSANADKPEPSSTPIMLTQLDSNDLPWDPADRKRIMDYHPDQRDEIRRKYLIRGPFQPRGIEFPKRSIGNKKRRFCPTWFYKFSNWLEYSVKVDRAFCLCCYLFRDQFGKQGGSDAFVMDGFNGWNKTERLGSHVGDVSSFHNRALRKCEDLMRREQAIVVAFCKPSDVVKTEYQVVEPSVQKDIVECVAHEVQKPMREEIGDDVFGLLLDESSDFCEKVQMSVVLRYVDACGIVKERFVGFVHMMERSALALKSAIESLFVEHGLNLKKVRGLGYNGACNMRVEFNGLKELIMMENSSAYYVHCFAHELQLVIVAVAKKHFGVGNFFDMIAVLTNVVCVSCKRKDTIQESHKEKVQEAIGTREVEPGSELNQQLSLVSAGYTSGSHYMKLLHLVDLFPLVVEVLKYVEKEGDNDMSQRQAYGLQIYFQSFDFVFYLHLMLRILGLTDPLTRTLQGKDKDIFNAVSIAKSTKQLLQKFRVDGFDSLLTKISSFCDNHDIEMLNMNEEYVNPKKQREKTSITYRHYYEFDCFNTVADMQIQEFNDRFSDVSSELLTCSAALNPHDSFREFDASMLLRLTEFYPDDFSSVDRMTLEHHLDLYIDIVREDKRFANLNGIADLARVMVETRKHLSHYLVYQLLKLALILPVASARVER